MHTSLKRKKPGAAPARKGAAKKAKTVAIPTKAVAQTASTEATTASLAHLIDRPYVQYSPSEDDIGIPSSYLSLMVQSFRFWNVKMLRRINWC